MKVKYFIISSADASGKFRTLPFIPVNKHNSEIKSELKMMEETKVNILLVEDDHVDVMNMQRALKKNNINHTLHIAFNGIEALHMLRGTGGKPRIAPAPTIILTDINMPKMNGIEFIREIRNDEEFRSMCVFVLTTSNDANDKKDAYDLNVAGYILKPLSFEKFVQTINILSSYWKICEHSENTVQHF